MKKYIAFIAFLLPLTCATAQKPASMSFGDYKKSDTVYHILLIDGHIFTGDRTMLLSLLPYAHDSLMVQSRDPNYFVYQVKKVPQVYGIAIRNQFGFWEITKPWTDQMPRIEKYADKAPIIRYPYSDSDYQFKQSLTLGNPVGVRWIIKIKNDY